jgi:hypothetical protein
MSLRIELDPMNKKHTETIDGNVIPMILPEDVHLARSGAEGITIKEEDNLDTCREFVSR